MAVLFEILLFGYLFYTHFSIVINIYVPGLAGAWILLLAWVSLFYTLVKRDKHRKTTLILVGVSTLVFVFVQFFFSVPFSTLKPHLIWVAYIVIIFPHIHRPNFIKRLVIVLSSIILLLVPFITYIGDIPRARLLGTGIDNANVVGAWIGFCALSCWLWGGTTKKRSAKFWLWGLTALLCFYMLQTVSRGSLIGLLIAVGISFRHGKFKGTLIKLILLLISSIIALKIPIVANAIAGYEARMFVETGRLEIWPLAFELFKKQPWFGYGADHVQVFVRYRYLLPHNVFLYMLLAGGIFTTIPFVILWLKTLLSSFWPKVAIENRGIDPLPLVIFVLIQFMSFDVAYLSVFSALVICYSLSHKSQKNNTSMKIVKTTSLNTLFK